jgi:hypothetical protein
MTELSTAISLMPSELDLDSCLDAPYTPKRTRTAIQDSSTLSGKWSGRSGISVRKSHVDGLETPRSIRSQSLAKHTSRSNHGTPSAFPVETTPREKMDCPLVLLHVTLLPIVHRYSKESMQAILPDHILENFRLLQSKVGDATILGRGILLPHPRHEYELLEERLLESLELLAPKILKCGHYFADSDEEEDDLEGQHSLSEIQDAETTESGCNLCTDCSSPIKRPQDGIGKGKRLWNIKFFAANGLMRSGAWSAAWREMERVDAEIEPWIPQDLRRTLDRMREEEEAEARNIEAQMEREALEAERVRLEAMIPANDSTTFDITRTTPSPNNSLVVSLSDRPLTPVVMSNQITLSSAHESEMQMDLFEDFLQTSSTPQSNAFGTELIELGEKPQVPLSLLLKNYLHIQLKNHGHGIILSTLIILVLVCGISMNGLIFGTSELHASVLKSHPIQETVSVTHTVTKLAIQTPLEETHVLETPISIKTTTESIELTVTQLSTVYVTPASPSVIPLMSPLPNLNPSARIVKKDGNEGVLAENGKPAEGDAWGHGALDDIVTKALPSIEELPEHMLTCDLHPFSRACHASFL